MSLNGLLPVILAQRRIDVVSMVIFCAMLRKRLTAFPFEINDP